MIPPRPTDEPTLPTPPVPVPARPGPSRRTAVLVAVWTVLVAGVSSGITAALVGGGSGDVEDGAAPVVSPSIWQDTRTYPADPPLEPETVPSPTPATKDFAVGEKAKSGGATVVVKKVGEAATVTLYDFDSDKILKAGTGAKFAILETTVQNDGTDSFDPVCGGGISQGLVDAEGRKFDAIKELFLVKANQKAEACGEELQPGFKRDAVFVYKIPADASPAEWTFSGSQGMTEGDLTTVRLAAGATSG
ncbi:DUF4352 domain-containing protein [Streptomyces sp. R302]|uniref:DUF4352 domain-containing protein n=1 Tax=unclassified Streptomyces TaxID=2593676 RepID=UPI00145E91C5|nr:MULTISPECIES: DUF4352 domain-containing protein [unclassified Streptomyces]NML55284.1 DUF4352 domain-containing protein [Streptomyces sp. R301]NML82704.1 DUF4352 domain-containing protein [Streptomyces sp. R302]